MSVGFYDSGVETFRFHCLHKLVPVHFVKGLLEVDENNVGAWSHLRLYLLVYLLLQVCLGIFNKIEELCNVLQT